LQFMGLVYHDEFKVLLCVCGKAIQADRAVIHVEGHGLSLTRAQRAEFEEFMDHHDVASYPSDICHPTPGGPPVEILKQIPDGFCCNMCSYCAPEKKTFNNHWYATHGKEVQMPVALRHHQGTLQTFFHPVGVQYFEVNPSLSTVTKDDPFAIYIRDEVSKYAPFPATLPLNAREVPPLLQITQWHTHLGDYAVDYQKRSGLWSLVTLPTSATLTGIGALGAIVFKYMKRIRLLANKSSLAMRCLLIECPR